jgi:hypothetical protein
VLGGWADAQQEGDFDEDEDEGGDADWKLAGGEFGGEEGDGNGRTDKQRTLQRMMMSKWKMFAIPRAKQRMMQRTPVLEGVLLVLHRGLFEAAVSLPLPVYTWSNRVSSCSIVLRAQWLVDSSLTEVPRPELLGERHVGWMCGF